MEHATHAYFIMVWICLSEGVASFITSYKTTWENAINKCTLETPTIMFDGPGKTLHVHYNLSANSDVWVGHYLVATAFRYIGCMEVGNMEEKADYDYITPGLCYSACNNTNAVGLSMSKCYCLFDTIRSNRSMAKCSSRCKSQKNIACGSHGYMSIYEIEPDAIPYTGRGRCLQFAITNGIKTWSWFGCKRERKVICINNHKHGDEMIDNDENRKEKWRDAMNKCFEDFKLPVSVKELELFEGQANLAPSWTGVVTSHVIYSNGSSATNRKSKRSGYLQKQKNETLTVLNFDNKRTIKRHVLCKNAIKAIKTFGKVSDEAMLLSRTKRESEIVSVTEGTATTTLELTEQNRDSSHPTNEPTTSVSSTEEAYELTTKCTDFSSYIGYVGVLVVYLITLVAAGVGLVLLKRSRKKINMPGRIHSSDKSTNCKLDSFLDCSQTYEFSSENFYENVDDPVSQTDMATPGDSLDGCDNNVHVFHDLEINPMDFSTKRELKDCNADEGEDNDYDILNLSVKTRYIVDDTYDTTQTAAMKLKAKHSTEEN